MGQGELPRTKERDTEQQFHIRSLHCFAGSTDTSHDEIDARPAVAPIIMDATLSSLSQEMSATSSNLLDWLYAWQRPDSPELHDPQRAA